ncbi:MAG TPA: FecR domain-containing protein [Croceibacterium sp.]|nr:FecR domain-containing protein [Croceibacterium sp.]
MSPQDQIDEDAAIWCARIFGHSSESFDSEAFQQWIADDDAHRHAFDSMARTWRQLEGFEPSLAEPRSDDTTEELEEGLDAPVEAPLFDRRRALIAATVAGLLAAGGYTYVSGRSSVHETDIGRGSLVKLDDGSQVALDGATRVRYASDGSSRTVWLDGGRALFEVAHDPDRPFSVHAGDTVVVAVGTSFSVERLHDQIRANLVSGSVDVVDNGATGGVKRYRLQNSGDMFIAQDDGSTPIIATGGSDLSWTGGVLNFDNESLPVTIERVNRYSTLQIVLAPGLEGERVSGIFKAGETEEFIAAACELLNLRAERSGTTVRLVPATP